MHRTRCTAQQNTAKLRIDTYTGFNSLPRGYTCLFEESCRKSFFYSMPWFKNLAAAVLENNDVVRIYGVVMDDVAQTPVAALVMQYKNVSSGRLRSYQLSGLSNYYSSLFGPIVGNLPYSIHDIMQHLVGAICSDTPMWHVIDCNPLDIESLCYAALVDSLQNCGMIVQTYFCFGNWYLQVNGRSYKEYFETLPSTMKSTLKRKSKKWEKQAGARLEIITGGNDLAAAIEAYEKVYRVSWKVPEPYPLFIRGLIHTCAATGLLRLGLAYVEDEPVAAQLWIVNEGTASIYKLAYDERWAHLSIGSILTARLMEYVIEVDKVREVDYLTGDDSYKQTWMSHRRERWGIRAFNPWTLKGLFGAIRHIGGHAVKTMWQRSRRPQQ